ncbi:MAG: hypothetical protein L6Q92_12550 [Phycisphaerae bacterium]|nr:hypothetical protein [Phycisphaerae bacterium]
MRPETLRRLMLDRALDQLSPDAVELLDAYVRERPAERAELEQLVSIGQTAARALKTVGDSAAVELAPFPRRRIASAGRIPLVRVRTAVAMAACLLIGVLVGTRSMPQAEAPSGERIAFASANGGSRSIWRVDIDELNPPRDSRAGETRTIRWTSPLEIPQTKGAL